MSGKDEVNPLAPKESFKAETNRFEGEISCLGLSEIIQLNVHNRFSGCIEVHDEERQGLIFLRDGEIVHAEQEGILGEAAFYEIVSWPGGRFSLQENVATTRSTIKKSCQFLILEAHRLMDERRRRADPAAPPPARRPAAATAADTPAATAAKPTSAAVLLEKLRGIPGVAYAVLLDKEGGRIGDDRYEAEVLAGQALYVAMVGRQLGEKLQAGEIRSAVVQGTTGHLLLFALKNHFIAVLVRSEAQVGAIESEVRKALAAPR